ncbi:tRNA pseudouridine synthase A [Brumimicrobium mesophilum]|uniref:tRNA pseudouridine(38-40) synthase TruA n=1 Tax=Brumimicrobium mesophilum TaxID=392717 RepID=UPI000D143DAB|nr:tRNA pseudouridine(38-40) synthase TruA [Brumimicrobium mesophilum]
MRTRFYYLMEIQYLGFRYHGWQKQPNVITVQEMITKTLNWVLPDTASKVLASGRTDAKVSVNQTYIEIFTDKEIEDLDFFFEDFNTNLPADVKALSVVPTTPEFNIIQSDKVKEYHYYFAFGEKFHPYCAAFMCNILQDLDIEIMQKAARLFEGKKDFYSYTFRPNPETKTNGEVLSCELTENTELTASFFPEKSYLVKVKGIGFKRNQIRLMMGMLFELGQGLKTWEEFLETLDGANKVKLSYNAPASGLQLHDVELIGK